ncbi:hypothetical protein ACHAWF_007517 [Thalassiosira exigua]
MTSFRIAILFLFSIALREKSVAEKPAAIAADGEWETWSQCSCPANDPGYDPTQDRPPSAKMAYLISVHNRRTLQDGAHLLKAIMETSFPGNTAIILIHVDGRVGISSRESAAEKDDEGTNYLYHDSPLRKYVDACLDTPICARNGRSGLRDESGNNAMVLEVHSHFSPEWSKWSMNDPTLWAMDYLTHHKRLKRRPGAGSWDVFVNLSGDTLPVVTAERIAQLFEPQKGPLGSTNFVTSSSCVTGLVPTSIFHFPKGGMKRAHYFQHGIPKKMSYIDSSTGKWENDVETTIYFGSQWMALTHDFVEYVVRSMDHPNGQGNVLKETLIDTAVLMTDETFFATLLMNAAEFNSTIPQLNSDGALKSYPSLHALRYERMDENIPNSWGKVRTLAATYFLH